MINLDIKKIREAGQPDESIIFKLDQQDSFSGIYKNYKLCLSQEIIGETELLGKIVSFTERTFPRNFYPLLNSQEITFLSVYNYPERTEFYKNLEIEYYQVRIPYYFDKLPDEFFEKSKKLIKTIIDDGYDHSLLSKLDTVFDFRNIPEVMTPDKFAELAYNLYYNDKFAESIEKEADYWPVCNSDFRSQYLFGMILYNYDIKTAIDIIIKYFRYIYGFLHTMSAPEMLLIDKKFVESKIRKIRKITGD